MPADLSFSKNHSSRVYTKSPLSSPGQLSGTKGIFLRLMTKSLRLHGIKVCEMHSTQLLIEDIKYLGVTTRSMAQVLSSTIPTYHSAVS
jgi:propanediol utilization protein